MEEKTGEPTMHGQTKEEKTDKEGPPMHENKTEEQKEWWKAFEMVNQVDIQETEENAPPMDKKRDWWKAYEEVKEIAFPETEENSEAPKQAQKDKIESPKQAQSSMQATEKSESSMEGSPAKQRPSLKRKAISTEALYGDSQEHADDCEASQSIGYY